MDSDLCVRSEAQEELCWWKGSGKDGVTVYLDDDSAVFFKQQGDLFFPGDI